MSVYLKLLEDKVEELKYSQEMDTSHSEEIRKKLDTTIDLNISAYLEDDFFDSDLDKLNFYREIESISSLEELDELIEDFKEFS
jgi:transcription-repair coupling factor (superfamily II helicase)